MALQYCQVCGVLIPNAPPGVDATICEKCFSTRKLIIAGDEDSSGSYPLPGSNATTAVPDRVQFPCPSCRSVLALAPVKKRTKIKCPRCVVDFYMFPDGRIEGSTSSAPTSPPAPSSSATVAASPGPQSKLLEDLKPLSDLDEILERVPEKKVQALSSVLDSDRYATFDQDSSSGAAPKLPPTPAPAAAPAAPPKLKTTRLAPPRPAPPPSAPRPVAAPEAESGYELLADSDETGGAVAFADKVIEQPGAPPASPNDSAKRQGRIATARRSKDAVEKARRERDERDLRAANASRHTLALLERRRREAFAAARLFALALAPAVIALVFLASTTQETGFATKGSFGVRLTDLGEIVRRGTDGWKTLLTGK